MERDSNPRYPFGYTPSESAAPLHHQCNAFERRAFNHSCHPSTNKTMPAHAGRVHGTKGVPRSVPLRSPERHRRSSIRMPVELKRTCTDSLRSVCVYSAIPASARTDAQRCPCAKPNQMEGDVDTSRGAIVLPSALASRFVAIPRFAPVCTTVRGSLDHRLWLGCTEHPLILNAVAVILNPLPSDCFEFRLDARCAADRAAIIYLRTHRSVTAYRASHVRT